MEAVTLQLWSPGPGMLFGRCLSRLQERAQRRCLIGPTPEQNVTAAAGLWRAAHRAGSVQQLYSTGTKQQPDSPRLACCMLFRPYQRWFVAGFAGTAKRLASFYYPSSPHQQRVCWLSSFTTLAPLFASFLVQLTARTRQLSSGCCRPFCTIYPLIRVDLEAGTLTILQFREFWVITSPHCAWLRTAYRRANS
ncbi:hypothetical protein BR93DRAFT_327489 [Coniochaeta sp. PMI_546]|nr:hypothetical protein BR93DRAFT_327489 [Coniochaeta sp. PMI_546]